MRASTRGHVLACALLLAAGAQASDVALPEARRADAPCHATLADAARAALAIAMPLSATVEFGGAILLLDGAFCYTQPVTSDSGTHVYFRLFAAPEATVAALYHTHPANAPARDARTFSEADVRTSTEARVPSFLGVAKTGVVRVFDPAKMNGRDQRDNWQRMPGRNVE